MHMMLDVRGFRASHLKVVDFIGVVNYESHSQNLVGNILQTSLVCQFPIKKLALVFENFSM